MICFISKNDAPRTTKYTRKDRLSPVFEGGLAKESNKSYWSPKTAIRVSRAWIGFFLKRTSKDSRCSHKQCGTLEHDFEFAYRSIRNDIRVRIMDGSGIRVRTEAAVAVEVFVFRDALVLVLEKVLGLCWEWQTKTTHDATEFGEAGANWTIHRVLIYVEIGRGVVIGQRLSEKRHRTEQRTVDTIETGARLNKTSMLLERQCRSPR